MSGLFGSLNTATKGLHAQQTALQTIGHNVANASTPGYTRQRVSMQADISTSIPGVGQVGTGVRISGVNRVNDQYITNQLRDGYSTTMTHETLSDIIGQLEAIFNEPSDTGLSNQISEVFNAWTYLASNPEQDSARTMLVQTSETFTDVMNHMANAMESLRADTVNELDKGAVDANSTLEQLDKLNYQIWQASVRGYTPNDLLDQQDRLLQDLSGQIEISAEKDKYNRVSVSIDGETVLDSSSQKELAIVIGHNEEGQAVFSNGDALDSDAKVGDVFVRTPGEENTYTGITAKEGSLKGAQDAIDVIVDMQAKLDGFATDFATAVNMIHSSNGEGQDFFNLDSTNAASSIQVADELKENPGLVISGKDSDNALAGDGSRAQLIASLQNTTLASDSGEWNFNEEEMTFESSGTGSTLFSRYNSLVTEMGIVKQQSDNMLDTQNGLMNLLIQRRESISGVDINEEIVDMIKYSSAFQANSRVLQTLSDMLDTLINRTGV